jgi:hypothetical protein
LIADLPDNNTSQPQTRETSGDDGDEWWGLDYAVELSRNENDELNTSSFPASGEHSKVCLTFVLRQSRLMSYQCKEPRIMGRYPSSWDSSSVSE